MIAFLVVPTKVGVSFAVLLVLLAFKFITIAHNHGNKFSSEFEIAVFFT